MKTFIIAYKEDTDIPNLAHLPNSFVANVNQEPSRFLVHKAPNITIEDNSVICNFDLFLSSSLRNDFSEFHYLIPEKLLEMKRLSKAAQSVLFLKIAQKLKLRLFKTVSHWHGGVDLAIPFNKYIVKPNHGARGIGQVLVKDDLSPVALCEEILRYGSTATTLKEKFPEVILNTGTERRENEGLESIRNQGMTICEYIEDVKSEYRLLVSNGKVIHAIKRTFKTESDFKQATGVRKKLVEKESDISQFAGLDTIMPKKYTKEIEAFVAEIGEGLYSFDIFITKRHQWGCFEFSNEFGTSAYTPKSVVEMHKNFIADTIAKRYMSSSARGRE